MAKARSADRQRYWRKVIERQQASGQSINGFCAQKKVSPASFHAWKRRLRRSQRGIEGALPATSHPLVHEAMIWTQQLYDIEDRAKEMSPEDRRAFGQAEALPILTRMKARFDEVRPTAKLAEAIDYVLNRWEAFVRYTSDGRIPIDNNVIERLLRPVALGRKNYTCFSEASMVARRQRHSTRWCRVLGGTALTCGHT